MEISQEEKKISSSNKKICNGHCDIDVIIDKSTKSKKMICHSCKKGINKNKLA